MCEIKSWIVYTLFLVLLHCLTTRGAEHGVQLEITTDPPGPVYMASSWIRFACKATNHSSPETLHYKWIGFSNSVQGAQTLLVDDPLLGGDHSALIWLLSTSDVQYVECRLFNNTGILQSTGLDIAVTGAGVHFENAFLGAVANNTAVLNPGSSDFALLCQSALRNSCNTGNWKNPNDNYISNVTSLSQVCSNSEPISQFFSTAQLSLSPDLSSGLYTCVIPDETLLIRKVYIGVYSDIEERVKPFKSSMMLAHQTDHDNMLSLSCSTQMLPSSSAVWRKDGNRLSPTDTISTRISVVDVTDALYDSELVMEWSAHGVSLVSCLVHTEWITPGHYSYDAASASGNFVIMELRTSTSIQCTARNIAQVQWFNSQNQTLSTSQIPNIEVHGDTLSIVNATTSFNGAQFHCRGEDSNGKVQLWQHYSIIVSVPTDFVSVSLADNYTEPALEGDAYKITCCYNSTETAAPIVISWYEELKEIEHTINPNLFVSVEDTCSTLHFVRVSVEEDGYNYTCRAEMDPPLLYTGRTTLHTAHVTLSVDKRIIVATEPELVGSSATADLGSSAARLLSLPIISLVVFLTSVGIFAL